MIFLLQVAIAIALGMGIGIFTGICPGIHVNLVAATLFSISPVLLKYAEPLTLAVFIVALAVTHSFLDTIPSVYLGAPDDENAMSVLPAQKMLLHGEAYQAVKITILGAFSGLIAAIMLIPLFLLLAGKLYPILKPYLAYLLVGIVLFMILRKAPRAWNFSLFLLAGMLGTLVFSLPILREPLFPLLSGLFGVSGLLISYFENTKIPEQKITRGIDLEKKDLVKVICASSLGVALIQFFPGLGPAQGAVISGHFVKNIKDKAYLALVGAMGTMSVVFSLVTFYALGKAKDGSIVVISELLTVDLISFLMLVTAFLVAGSGAVFLVLFFSKKFSRLIEKVNYKALVVGIIAFVFVMCVFISGPLGLLVLATSTAIGLIAPLKEIDRSHAMGCLLLPVVFYLLL